MEKYKCPMCHQTSTNDEWNDATKVDLDGEDITLMGDETDLRFVGFTCPGCRNYIDYVRLEKR